MARTLAMEIRKRNRPLGYKSPAKAKKKRQPIPTTRKRLYKALAKVTVGGSQGLLKVTKNSHGKTTPFKVPKEVKKFDWRSVLMFDPNPDLVMNFHVS
jgi:hypothetical protein